MIRNHSLPSYAAGSTSSFSCSLLKDFLWFFHREVRGCQRPSAEPNHRTLWFELLTTEKYLLGKRLQKGKVCAEI